MLIIHAHNNHHKDREYIYDVVFRYFWDIEYQLVYEERDNIAIEVDGNFLYIDDTFFQKDETVWLKEQSLPEQPLTVVNLSDEFRDATVEIQLPMIYGDSNAKNLFSDNNSMCNIDIFGSAFFMLTRYEEVVKKERDTYGRFPATASLAYQEGFLERPIINEYLELLWRWITKYKKDLKRRERKFSIMPTHDVDVPFLALCLNNWKKIRLLAGDIIKRRSLSSFCKNMSLFIASSFGKYDIDPRNTFEYIMDFSEKFNLTSTFYLMTSRNRNEKDGNYSIFKKPIVKLAQTIVERGHCIGIHPGFGSYNNKVWLKNDVDVLGQMISKEGLDVEYFGGRQHYLSWQAPITWEEYEDVGIKYDTTLSYADHIGFRCGTCFEYPVYNVITRKGYKLKEYPLVVMDCTLWDDRYMNLREDEMLPRCMKIKERCRKYGGNFVLLWHNTTFINKLYKELYENIILK